MKIQDIDECRENIDSKYKLCILVSKRIRELREYFSAQGRIERTKIVKPLVNIESRDPLEIAFSEVKEGKIILIESEDK